MLPNPNKKFAKSEGVDLPLMYVYLAGRIAGNCIEQCLEWRHKIIKHYRDYKPIYAPEVNGLGIVLDTVELIGYESYPIAFLDALNSKESDSVDAKGLTSAIPPNLIYDKDMLSVKRADVVVANMEDYMEEEIKDILALTQMDFHERDKSTLINYIIQLQDVIINRRPNYGTTCEVAWAFWLQKPVILIAGTRDRKDILTKHPFMKRASVIVETVEELLEKKWLQILYKSIASATY